MARFVFGTGIALINNWKIIEKNFKPDYCIDNNQSKWGKRDKYTGLFCINPERLNSFENPEVLITVGDPYVIEIIKQQLLSMGISPLILSDFIGQWGSKEEFPEHLVPLRHSLSNKRIILFNTPEHDNIGDHIITLSELQFLSHRFSDYEIFEVTDIEYLWFGEEIAKYVLDDDIILITGGGFMGSLWLYNGESNVRSIINRFKNNKVIILPQTIYFEDNERGKKELEKSLETYKSHENLTIYLREKKSYEFMQSDFSLKKISILMPDMALFYKITKSNHVRKKTALICFRKDKESILLEENQKKAENNLMDIGWHIIRTSMHSEVFSGLNGRKKQVEDKLNEIQSAGLVVTDTLHCMISAVLTGTPCIAFDNLSGKISNVYEWIENLPYIFLCKDINEMLFYLKQIDFKEYTYDSFDNMCVYLDRLEHAVRGENDEY